MAVKLIAIGNILMGDDGAGMKVVERVKDDLENRGINVIIGETDIHYCLSEIVDGDFIFIVDVCFDNECDDDIVIKSLNKLRDAGRYYSQHGVNLLSIINTYFSNVNGYFIGIKIQSTDIRFSCELSRNMQGKLKEVSELLINKIDDLLTHIN